MLGLLSLQVLDAKLVLDRPARPGGKPQRIAECTVGDQTGIILFTARNEQGGWWCMLCRPAGTDRRRQAGNLASPALLQWT